MRETSMAREMRMKKTRRNQFEGVRLVGEPVPSFSCRYEQSTTSTRRCLIRCSTPFKTVTKSLRIFLSVYLESLKRCYFGKTADVGKYDAMFAAWLRLPLMDLHCQLANYLGLAVNQIASNAWRIFIGAEVI